MKRFKNKKALIITLASVAAVIGITSGSVLAQGENEDPPQAGEQQEAVLERICEIYEANTGVAIDPEELQNACTEAREEIMEEAMANRLANMVENGIITQEEADQYLEWLEARPDIAPGMRNCQIEAGGPGRPGMTGHFGMAPGCGEFCPDTESFSTN